jgi:energy-coupling factor transporter ATP-binding protein EcfA2
VERYLRKEYAALLGVPVEAMDRPVYELPASLRLRVALESVAFSRPKAAFFLNPGAYLDEESRRQLSGQIERLSAQGCAVVILGTDPGLAARIAHRVLVLRAGRVAAERLPGAEGGIDLAELGIGYLS